MRFTSVVHSQWLTQDSVKWPIVCDCQAKDTDPALYRLTNRRTIGSHARTHTRLPGVTQLRSEPDANTEKVDARQLLWLVDNARDVSCQSTVSAAAEVSNHIGQVPYAFSRINACWHSSAPPSIAVSHSRRSAPMVLLLATDLRCCGIGAVRLLNILNLTPPPFPLWELR